MDRTLSADLREWRARLGLSQPQAATRLGVPLGTYRGWEQEQSPPAHPRLVRLAMERVEETA
jgi:DNA-binding transcriptional regulator YiaG